MGNRANVIFKQDNGYLGLYLHNGGGNYKEGVANALKRVIDAGRTDDIGYATRISVSELVGDDWSQDLSYGLYVGTTINEVIADNENDILVVNWSKEMVYINKFNFDNWEIEDVVQSYTFKEYMKQYE